MITTTFIIGVLSINAIVIAIAIVGAKRMSDLQDLKTLLHMDQGRLHIAQVQLQRRLEDISEDNS